MFGGREPAGSRGSGGGKRGLAPRDVETEREMLGDRTGRACVAPRVAGAACVVIARAALVLRTSGTLRDGGKLFT
jgi:hypothetical protein